MTEAEKEYDEILNKMIEKIGGKEYCLKQLLSEGEHKDFLKKYLKKNKEKIYLNFTNHEEEIDIIHIEIASSLWNKYLFRIFLYDTKKYEMYEYNIRDKSMIKMEIFSNEIKNSDKLFPKSVFYKFRGGNVLWENYEKNVLKTGEEENSEEELYMKYFVKKMKCFKFIPKGEEIFGGEELKKVSKNEIFETFTLSDIYYYEFSEINGYMTFNTEDNLLIEKKFAKLFDENIIKKLK